MQQIKYVALSTLKPNPDNPRTISDADLEKLKQSLQKNPDFFEVRPVLVNPKMVIFAGNQRFLAAQKLGLDKIPVVIMDIPPERQKELAARDNIPAGDWDPKKLMVDFSTDQLEFMGLDLNWDGNQKPENTGKAPRAYKQQMECPKCHHKWVKQNTESK